MFYYGVVGSAYVIIPLRGIRQFTIYTNVDEHTWKFYLPIGLQPLTFHDRYFLIIMRIFLFRPFRAWAWWGMFYYGTVGPVYVIIPLRGIRQFTIYTNVDECTWVW